MDHLSEIDLIELAAGHLPDGRRHACDAHLLACAECRTRFESIVAIHGQLGSWTDPLPPKDLSDSILQVLGQPDVIRLPDRRSFAWAAARIAASIAIAVGIGHLAGRLTWSEPRPPIALVTDDQAAQSLHLDEIGHMTAAELTDLLMSGPDASEPEDQG